MKIKVKELEFEMSETEFLAFCGKEYSIEPMLNKTPALVKKSIENLADSYFTIKEKDRIIVENLEGTLLLPEIPEIIGREGVVLMKDKESFHVELIPTDKYTDHPVIVVRANNISKIQ